MPTPDATTLAVSTEAFVRELRREFTRRTPDRVNPVPAWSDMRPIDRRSMMRCVGAALIASDPKHVERVTTP
jgi:hypothetical protein